MMQWVSTIPCNAFILRATLLLLGVGLISFFSILERIDAVFYDKLSTIHQFSADRNIVIVAIDDESLQMLGRWPWSRSIHAELINRLKRIDNRALAIDLLFTEPENSDPLADQRLAAAIANHGAIVLPIAPIMNNQERHIDLVEPLPIFRERALLGHVDIELDGDGIARRVYLKAGIEKPDWPVFSDVLAAYWQGEMDKSNSPDELGAVASGRWVRSQEVLIPYVGPPGSFKQIPYVRLLLDDHLLAELKDKIVLVGVTAAGVGMKFATPVSPINRQPMSGIEWHANVLSMILHDRAVYPISSLAASFISLSWVLALLLVTGIARTNITLLVLLGLLISGLLLIWIVLHFLHFWLPPTAAVVGTIAVYPLLNWRRINEFMQSLFAVRVRSNTALESVADGVVTTDVQDRIIYMNKGAERILGVLLSRVQGTQLSLILNLEPMRDDVHSKVEHSQLPLSAYGVNTVQCDLRAVSGEKRVVRITRQQLRDEHDALMGFVVAIADITDTVELTKQVIYQASYDALTELPNRSLLLVRFEEMIATVRQQGGEIVVFFITLDNFKKINDALGHRAGDELLKMVSLRLVKIAASDGVIARWGGDEFVMLFCNLSKESAVPQMASTILELMREEFRIYNQDIFVTVSIGVSFYPKDGSESESVLERASTATHRIKIDGGDSFGFYSAESSLVWTRDRLEFEKELRIALNEGQLQVLYQPIVNVRQRRMVRLEALVRWPHPTRGFPSPSDFLPLAESVGLMERLGSEVLEMACAAAKELLRTDNHLQVSVNVHPRQLLYGHFMQTLSQVLAETQLPASALILEITESGVVTDMGRASEILNLVKAIRVSIALDDFGTGYSSLTLLRELPIDILKIDKSFIRTLDRNSSDLTIVQTIIGLGVNLGLSVIAEGVEAERQVQLLMENHCTLQQGYYFSRPVSFASILHLLNDKDAASPVAIERLCDMAVTN